MKSLASLLFLSIVTQYVIFIAYLPFFLFGLAAALMYGEFNLLGLDFLTGFFFFSSTLLFIALTYLFKRYFLERKNPLNILYVFLSILAINVLVHYSAILNKTFFLFLAFLSVISYLQTVTTLQVKKQLESKNNSTAVQSMILSIIGGVILILQFTFDRYIWIGESIMKLTANQFNILWFEYGGFFFLSLSLLTSALYFAFFFGIRTLKKTLSNQTS